MSELLHTAKRVAGWANDGEQVEVFVAREANTEVRAYDGEVESLTAAESHGVGIRVVVGNRQGYAYAGALDEDVLVETLAEARDNAEFAQPDEFNGVAIDDGFAAAEVDLYREDLAALSTDEKVELAIGLERATLAADDRIVGIESAEFVDAIYESAVATNTGIASSTRETGCYLSTYALAEDDGETQTGFGFSVGRSPSELDIDIAAAAAGVRATRLLGAVKAPTARLTVVFDPWVTAQLLGIIGHTLTGDAVLKGRSMFAERMGEDVAAPSITLVDNPTDPAAFTASIVDGEGSRHAFDEAHQCRHARGISAQHIFGPPIRIGLYGFCRAPGFQGGIVCRRPGFADRPWVREPGASDISGRQRIPGPTGVGAAFGGQPCVRRLLDRRGGCDDPRRRTGRTRPRGHDRVDAAADSPGRGGRRQRPRMVADERCRHHSRGCRCNHVGHLTECGAQALASSSARCGPNRRRVWRFFTRSCLVLFKASPNSFRFRRAGI